VSDSVYIHGTGEEEQRRLSLMNDVLLNPASIREMALRGDETILDFGAGLGQFTRAMARAVYLYSLLYLALLFVAIMVDSTLRL